MLKHEHQETGLPLGETTGFHYRYAIADPQYFPSRCAGPQHGPALSPERSRLVASPPLTNPDIDPNNKALHGHKKEARQPCQQPVRHRGLEKVIVWWRYQPNEQLHVHQHQDDQDQP
jgi:hypothetical protein